MIKEYMASLGSRHGLTKYTLSNGIEIILNEDEIKELFEGSKLKGDIESLKAENQKLEYQRDYYKGLILDFKSVMNLMEKIKWENLF